MVVNEVHPKIIAAVFGEEWTEPSPEPTQSSESAAPSIKLSEEEEAEASLYRKMKKMGLPDEALRQKMMATEVHPKIIAAVLGEEWTENTPESSAPVPEAGGIVLSDDEEAVAAQYKKMRKMGLPDDAVRHKMVVSEVHPKIIAAVLGEEWSESPNKAPAATAMSDEEEAIAAQYREMQRTGLPDDAVRHKMVMNEIDPKIIAAVFGETSTEAPPAPVPQSDSLTAEEEAVVAHYKKMQRMGLPDDSVRHRMIVNEVDPRIIAAVFSEQSSVQSKLGRICVRIQALLTLLHMLWLWETNLRKSLHRRLLLQMITPSAL